LVQGGNWKYIPKSRWKKNCRDASSAEPKLSMSQIGLSEHRRDASPEDPNLSMSQEGLSE